jgi:para-aminobenzoate synthetase component 1
MIETLPWRDPVETARAHAGAPGLALLLSDGSPGGRWSYLALEPDAVVTLHREDGEDGLSRLRALLDGPPRGADGPPFAGGVVGLMAYEYARRLEPVGLAPEPGWPEIDLLRYRAVLAFDHHERRVLAVGEGAADAARAAGWAAAPVPLPPSDAAPAGSFEPEAPAGAYEAAVADVVARIADGELFQANIARAWTGRLRPGAQPFAVFERLARMSPAPFSAYLRLQDRALVSHSPERFLRIGSDGAAVETRPIKGTRPRGATAAEDAALKAELAASAKDRAENLMIVDLMRNDLARACEPGSVRVEELFAVESYASVHHLVSTVAGRLRPGADAAELLAATFPPGSITGAPKVQAMRVIAGHERARGPWCGTLFWAGSDGALDSSVLIRTAAFVEDAEGWRFRTLAGAGIVADSDPAQELAETEAKISGLRRALTEAG